MRKLLRIAVLGVLGLSGVLYACSIPESQFNETIEARYPAIGQFVEVGGQRIHYDRRGSGPAVVLIHGASGNLRDFTFSISDALAEAGFTAIAFDRPGFGYSERAEGDTFTPSSQAAVLREAVAALGIEKPVVVGHSFGGAVAAAWTVDAPESIAGNVIVSGVTYPWPAGDNMFHAATSTALLSRPINAMMRGRVLERGAGSAVEWVFQPQSPPVGYAEYLGAELASRPATFRENGRDITNVNEAMETLSPQYPAIPVPVELIHGTDDQIVPIEAHARRFEADLPAARLTELPGVGHMAHHVGIDALIAAVKRITGEGS